MMEKSHFTDLGIRTWLTQGTQCRRYEDFYMKVVNISIQNLVTSLWTMRYVCFHRRFIRSFLSEIAKHSKALELRYRQKR